MKTLTLKKSKLIDNLSEPNRIKNKKSHLEAKWSKVDGKLVCRWISVE